VYFYITSGPGAPEWSAARTVFLAASASALFACVDFYFQFPPPAGFGPQYVWLDSGVYRRAQGLFYEASTLGNFCAFFLVMVAVSLTRPRREAFVSRPVLLTGGALLATALVLSYSRASLLNLAASSAALLWIQRRRRRLHHAGWVALPAAMAAAAAAWYLFPVFTGHYWDRLSASAQFLFSSTEGVLSGRLSSWRALVDFLIANPSCALLGVGYKTLPYSNVTGQPVIGDNMYLTLLVETGIAGLAALLTLHGAILNAAWRAARHADSRVSFFGTWIFCFWIGQMFQMLSGDLLTYWRVLPFYFWALAVAVRAADEHSLSRSIQ
jgi:O-antigen ligase